MTEERLRVLLLDDEASLRKPLKDYLKKNFGYHVDAVASGEEALRQVEEALGRYDVALIDEVLLHQPDGIEVMQKIKARYPDIECIVFTGWGTDSRQRALRAGAFRYMEKPFDNDELAMLIRTAAQQVRLRDIGRAILSERDLDRVLEGITGAACSLALADEAAIALLAQTTDKIAVHAKIGPGEQVWTRHLKNQNLSKEIIRTGQIVYVPDTTQDDRVNPEVIKASIRSFVGVPIPGEGGNLGVLYVYSQQPGRFDEGSTMAVLQTLASQAGLAIANARAFQQTQAHAGYMEALVRAGQGFAKARGEQDLLALAWDFVRQQLRVSTFFVALYERQADMLRFPLHYDEGHPVPIPDRPLGDNPEQWGIAGYVVKTGQELSWPTDEQRRGQCESLGIKTVQIGRACESCFFLPLKAGDGVIGAMSIQSYDPHAFSPVLLDACRALGSQLSVALESARLFEAEARRRQEAEALREAALALSTTLDMGKVFENILAELQKVVPYDSASVQLLKGDRLEIIGGRGFPNLPELLGISFPIDGDNPNREVVRRQGPFIVADAPAAYRGFTGEPHIQAGIHGWLGVPMLLGDQLIGMIALDKRESGFYTREHARLAEAFATQAAIVIRNARLFQEAKEGRDYIHSLYEASSSVIALTEPKQVLLAIVDTICQTTGAWRAVVLLVDKGEEPQVLAQSGFDLHLEPATSIRPAGVSRQVIQARQPRFFPDTQTAASEVHPQMIEQGAKAAACLPLLLRGRAIGVLWIHFRKVHPFSETEQQALQIYAGQAAIAYDNARRIKELEHMRQAAKAMAGALEPAQVLHQIVESATQVLQADSSAIWSYDNGRNQFITEELVAYGIPLDELEKFRKKEPKKGGTADTVMDRGWVGVTDVSDPRYDFMGSSTLELLNSIGAKSFQGIALKVGDEKLGVLYVNYNRPRSFTDEDRRTLETFAYHAALALKKARLLEQVSKARDVARVVAQVTVLGDQEATLSSVAEGTKEAVDCDAVVLFVYDQTTGKLNHPPTMVGVRYPDRASRYGEVVPSSIVYEMLRQDKPYIVETIAEDVLFKDKRFARDEEIESCVVIPLKVAERKVGVMFVNYRTRHRFTTDELTNIELFANQAAVAIRNAQLYQAERRHAQALKAIQATSAAVSAVLDLGVLLPMITDKAADIFDAPATSLMLWDERHENLVIKAAFGLGDEYREKQRIAHSRVDKLVEERGLGPHVFDIHDEPIGDRELVENEDLYSVLVTPLMIGGELIGVLNVYSRGEARRFEEMEKELATIFANHAAIAIQNARRFRLRERLLKAGEVVTAEGELYPALEVIAESVKETIGCDVVSLYTCDQEKSEISYPSVVVGELYKPQEQADWQLVTEDRRLPIDLLGKHSVIRKLLEHGLSRFALCSAEDFILGAGNFVVREEIESSAGILLKIGEEVVGILFINYRSAHRFTDEERQSAELFTVQAALAIRSARRYEELKRTKGLVGARTALAWMGMANSAWRHSIEGHAINIRNAATLMRPAMPREGSLHEKLDLIEQLATKIFEKPITPPLSSEEGVETVMVNDLIAERMDQLWEDEAYQEVEPVLALEPEADIGVRVSPEWLRRALDLIIDNAVEAMANSPDPRLCITTSLVEERVEIAISDTGPGIAPEVYPKLFKEPIEQSRGDKGMGMGLLMVQAIVQTYGGDITVQSTGPQGTTMIVSLPVAR